MPKHMVIIFALLLSQFAQAQDVKTVRSLMDGAPSIQSQLGAETFVPFEVEKLANAKVWYFDYEWHRKHGIDIPQDGLKNASFLRNVLDGYAWISRSVKDPASAFTGEKRTFYTDYYGGYGMGVNHGSGRAGGAGLLQGKGMKTPMAKSKDPWHSNCAVQSIEAIDEALWSQILDSETKYGSNKIVAIILTGLDGEMKGGQAFPRALIIREFGIRPAHYMTNGQNFNFFQDRGRVAKALPTLLANLPYPETGRPSNDGDALRVGINGLVDREATVLAEYYAKRLFFGSVSPSNLEITGRRLDLGDHTSQEGYSKIYRVDFQKRTPFGETPEFLHLFSDFRNSLASTLPRNLRAALPSEKTMGERFNATYTRAREIEMVRLTGAPNELIDALQADPKVRDLGRTLVELAKAGNDETLFVDPAGWKNTGLYDVGAILKQLAAGESSAHEADEALARLLPNATLRQKLIENYVGFRWVLAKKAQAENIQAGALTTYLREAVELRNRQRPDLVRGDRRWKKLWDLNDRSIHENAPDLVQTYIEQQERANIFNFKDAAPFQLILDETKDSVTGVSVRKVFDAKTNRHELVLRLDVSSGFAMMGGQKIAAADLEAKKFEMGHEAIQGVRSGDAVEFHLGSELGLEPDLNVITALRPVKSSETHHAILCKEAI